MIRLSVIVPTCNRSAYIDRFLASISKQNVSSDFLEVVVVDNGSTDSTQKTVLSYRDRVKRLHYILEPTPGLHAARHAGLRASNADTLVYADDDTEPFSTWLEAIAEAFQDESVVAVGGKCLPKFEATPPDWIDRLWNRRSSDGMRVVDYLSVMDLGEDVKQISSEFIFGCNMSIRRSTLIEAGGFHPDSMPDDLLRYRGDGETHVMRYVAKMGYKALYHPKACVYHAVPQSRMTIEYFCQRAFRQGISDSYTRVRERLRDHQSFSQRVIRKTKRALGNALKGSRNFTNSMGDPAIERSYREGLDYHASELSRDPELVAWVSKETYFD